MSSALIKIYYLPYHFTIKLERKYALIHLKMSDLDVSRGLEQAKRWLE